MPDAAGEVIVIGRPNETTSGSYQYNFTPSPGGAPGGGGANQQLRDNESSANNSVDIDSDAVDEEVTVIARSHKSYNRDLLMQLTPARTIFLPCLGPVGTNAIRGIALGLKFRVKTKSFGLGRTGENLAGTNTPVYVDINKQAYIDYSKLSGGLAYLTLHEIAHSFKAMRDFNKSQFEAYSAGAGAGLSYEDRVAQFPSSPEFAENEARANAIAKEIADTLAGNGNTFGFTPAHGYTHSC